MDTSGHRAHGLGGPTLAHQDAAATARPTESLPYTVDTVRAEATLLQVVAQRKAAYHKHLPDFAAGLVEPEADDTAPDCTLWVARSKADGAVLGSMRVQTNALRPLSMERSVRLPAPLQGARLSDARRLAVVAGPRGNGVRQAIFKANQLRLQAQGVEWSVVAARPPLTRLYLGLLFTDVLEGATFTPEPVAGNVPHQLLALALADAEARFERAVPSWHRYVYGTHHPDITIDGCAGSASTRAAHDRIEQATR